jgi:hypothetical protein
VVVGLLACAINMKYTDELQQRHKEEEEEEEEGEEKF